MKKALLIVLSSALFGANDKPMTVGLALAYMNNIVEAGSEKYNVLKDSDNTLKTDLDLFYSDTYRIADFTATYVYDGRFGITAAVPVMTNTLSDETGVSDATVGIHFNAGDFGEPQMYSNVFELRYSFDSGDGKKGLGSGSPGLSIQWDSSGYFGNGFEGFFSLMWKYYLQKVSLSDGASYRPGGEDTGWIGIRHACLLTDRVDTNLKLNWQTKFSDEDVVGNVGKNTDGYNIVDLTLEWSSDRLLRHFPFKAGVKIPVWDSDEVQNEFGVFIGAGAAF